MSYIRSVAGGATSAGLLMVLGGRGITGMDYARQAGAAAVSVTVGDYYKNMYGDNSMASMALSTGVGGLTFAAINRYVLGSQDSWGTLFAGGVVIDVVASLIENPLGNALGL